MDVDLVIRGGSVVDGTGAPARRADVAIVGDRITAVGPLDGRGHARSTPTAGSSPRASSTSTPTSTPSSRGTRSGRRRAGTASPRSCSATAA